MHCKRSYQLVHVTCLFILGASMNAFAVFPLWISKRLTNASMPARLINESIQLGQSHNLPLAVPHEPVLCSLKR